MNWMIISFSILIVPFQEKLVSEALWCVCVCVHMGRVLSERSVRVLS